MLNWQKLILKYVIWQDVFCKILNLAFKICTRNTSLYTYLLFFINVCYTELYIVNYRIHIVFFLNDDGRKAKKSLVFSNIFIKRWHFILKCWIEKLICGFFSPLSLMISWKMTSNIFFSCQNFSLVISNIALNIFT